MTGLSSDPPIYSSSVRLRDSHGFSLSRLHGSRRGRPWHLQLRRIHRDRFTAHLLQERDHGENFVLREPDGILVNVGHPGRIFLRRTLMTIIEIDIGLRLGQAFEDEVAAEFGADSLQVRAAGGLAGTDGMTKRALAFAEENLLPDRRHVSG